MVFLASRSISSRGKPGRTFSADLRVRASVSGLCTYLEVTVVCGAPELDPADITKPTVINPRIIVVVLGPSTANYDRGEKLGHCKTIATLSEVILVVHNRDELEIIRREDDGSWSRHIVRPREIVQLASIPCALAVDDVYHDPLS